ncbi:MAG: type III-B CRISPR module-associated protein Cmr5 [Verrucomicrobia bacterium]|nr:type III-B CRISPR module-associated protein Cmr5 [Verrucomicrobiota bacterium]
MKSLSQIRAANALTSAHRDGMGLGQQGGNALSGFPMLIKSDGLLPALAFAVERKPGGGRKQPGCFLIAQAIAEHLSSEGVAIAEADEPDALVDELARANDDSQLRRATAEAIAFLNYLKRFVA